MEKSNPLCFDPIETMEINVKKGPPNIDPIRRAGEVNVCIHLENYVNFQSWTENLDECERSLAILSNQNNTT